MDSLGSLLLGLVVLLLVLVTIGLIGALIFGAYVGFMLASGLWKV